LGPRPPSPDTGRLAGIYPRYPQPVDGSYPEIMCIESRLGDGVARKPTECCGTPLPWRQEDHQPT
jgi:hypothetical protein